MRYEEFLAEYDQVYDDWACGKVPDIAAEREIARLRELVPQIDDVERREWGERLLRRWESEVSGPARDRMNRAHDVLARASRVGGSEDERLARHRQGIADITSIANESDDEAEQLAIVQLNELLSTLIHGIEYDRQHQPEP